MEITIKRVVIIVLILVFLLTGITTFLFAGDESPEPLEPPESEYALDNDDNLIHAGGDQITAEYLTETETNGVLNPDNINELDEGDIIIESPDRGDVLIWEEPVTGEQYELVTVQQDGIQEPPEEGEPATYVLEFVDDRPEELRADEELSITYTVTNTGDVSGDKEVRVQLDDEEFITEQVALEPGESIELEAVFTPGGEMVGDRELIISTEDDEIFYDVFFEEPITEITNWHELNSIRENPDREYILMNDLTTETEGYEDVAGNNANNGEGWEPIEEFSGGFDGQGNSLEGVHIIGQQRSSGTSFIDTNTGTIKDVEFNNTDITVGNNSSVVSGLVLVNDGEISNIDYSGTLITGDNASDVGGLVWLQNGTMENITVDMMVNTSDSNDSIAGVINEIGSEGSVSNIDADIGMSLGDDGSRTAGVATLVRGSIDDLEADITVNSDSQIDDFAGVTYSISNDGEMTNNDVITRINAETIRETGGFVNSNSGSISGGTIETELTSEEIEDSGGIVKRSGGSIEDLSFTTDVRTTTSENVGGIIETNSGNISMIEGEVNISSNELHNIGGIIVTNNSVVDTIMVDSTIEGTSNEEYISNGVVQNTNTGNISNVVVDGQIQLGQGASDIAGITVLNEGSITQVHSNSHITIGDDSTRVSGMVVENSVGSGLTDSFTSTTITITGTTQDRPVSVIFDNNSGAGVVDNIFWNTDETGDAHNASRVSIIGITELQTNDMVGDDIDDDFQELIDEIGWTTLGNDYPTIPAFT